MSAQVLSLVVAVSFALPVVAESAWENQCLQNAMQMKAQGRYKEAVSLLSDHLREDPRSVRTLSLRSGCLLQMGDHTRALQDANRIVKMDPKSPVGYHSIGNVYKESVMPKEAIEAYSKALKLCTDPYEKASILYHRGSQYAALGQIQKCIDDSTKALETESGHNVDVLGQRGVAYQALHQHEKAIKDFTALIDGLSKRKDKGGSKYIMYRARSYEEIGKFDKAIEDYTLSLKFQPRDEHCLSKRAECYSRSKRHSQAIVDYTRVIELDPDSWRTFLARGKEYCITKEFKKGIEDFNKALKLEPPQPATIYEARSKAHALLGDKTRASADLELARKAKVSVPF